MVIVWRLQSQAEGIAVRGRYSCLCRYRPIPEHGSYVPMLKLKDTSRDNKEQINWCRKQFRVIEACWCTWSRDKKEIRVTSQDYSHLEIEFFSFSDFSNHHVISLCKTLAASIDSCLNNRSYWDVCCDSVEGRCLKLHILWLFRWVLHMAIKFLFMNIAIPFCSHSDVK